MTFLCHGSRAFFEKSLIDIPFDDHLISGLDSRQACYLGIRVGELIDEEIDKFQKIHEKNKKSSDFNNSQKGMNLSFDRYGNIMYFGKKTKKLECVRAIDAVRNDKIIGQFNPRVSYSIGVLVGKNIRKQRMENVLFEPTSSDAKIIIFRQYS